VELLLPRTDAAVLVEFVLVVVVLTVALTLVWRHREWRSLVAGSGLLLLGLMGLRVLH